MGDFEVDTRLEPMGDDRFRATLSPDWEIWGPNDDPWLDAGRALVMIDTAAWIAAVQPHPDSAFTAPNVDVTAWFHRAEPECEWLLMDHSCLVAASGPMGAHARIWSESGQLLASGGAQLFCVPSAGD